MLNYCLRFYDRQFITREDLNKGILAHSENLLSDYSDKAQTLGLPTVGYFAEKLNLSANYFGDLMKKETGKSAQEHLHLKLIDKAKEKIFDTDKTISQIAYELGFQYPQHFSRLFKHETGYSLTSIGRSTDTSQRPKSSTLLGVIKLSSNCFSGRKINST